MGNISLLMQLIKFYLFHFTYFYISVNSVNILIVNLL